MNTISMIFNNTSLSAATNSPSTLRASETGQTKPFSLPSADNPESPITDTPIKNSKLRPKGTEDTSTQCPLQDCGNTALQKPDRSEDKAKIKNDGSTTKASPAGVIEQFSLDRELPAANIALVKGSVKVINPTLADQQQKVTENRSKADQLINSSYLNKLKPFLDNIPQKLNTIDKKLESAEAAYKAHVSKARDVILTNLSNQKTKIEERLASIDTTKFSAGRVNNNFSPTQDKLLDPSSVVPKGRKMDNEQKAAIGPGKSVSIAKKTVDSAPVAKSTDYNIADLTSPAVAGYAKAGRKTLSTALDGKGGKASDNLSSDSLLQKLKVTELQISTGQNKDGDSSSRNSRTTVLDSRFFASTSIENPASTVEFGKFLTSAQATNTANSSVQASLRDASKSIGEQIIESIQASLQTIDKQITIRLEPPDLGKIFVKFQEHEDQIIGLLEVTKAQVKYEIEQALPQIIRTLTDIGVNIKRLEVQLNNQLEQQADKYQSLADGAFEQYRSFEQDNSDNTSTGEVVSDTYSYEDIRDQSRITSGFISDGSINILI